MEKIITYKEVAAALRMWCKQEQIKKVQFTVEGEWIYIYIQDTPKPAKD